VVEAIIRTGSLGVPVVNAAGKLTLLQSAALLDRCAVVLTNDSGLMHVASARKRPLVAVFGSTVRRLGFAPYGHQSIVVERPEVLCRPCTGIGRARCPQGHFRCMLDISDDQVVAAASTLLRS
jgi:heptosyltransferase-2